MSKDTAVFNSEAKDAKKLKRQKMLENRIIAVDYGFGYTKACDEFGTKVKFLSLSKRYMEPKIEQDIELQEYLAVIDGTKYQIGEFAKIGDVTKMWDMLQATDPLNLKIFIGASLNLIVSKNPSKYPKGEDGAIHLNLSVGLPIDLFKTQKPELEKILKDMNTTVAIGKNKYTFIIDSLLISQQGVGAFFAFAYDMAGNQRGLDDIAKELESYMIANPDGATPDYKSFAQQIINFGLGFCDIGYNTLDCFKITKKNKQFIIVDESAFSLENKGIHNYHEKALTNIIIDRGPIVKDIIACESALEETGGEIKHGRQIINIKPYFDNIYNELAYDFKNSINQKWGGVNDLGAILLCGGGSYSLYGKLDLPVTVFIMKDAEYANAVGFVIKMSAIINNMKQK
ncbi:MAG: ParM/StbA family protein [Clostridiales bacterium]|nr:ParM/StbA family protein [Clostridiales bacterium]